MSFEAQFLQLMPHTIQLTAPTGRNAQGTPTYVGGTPRPYRARIVGDILSVRTMAQASETQDFIVYVASGGDPITAEHQLVLPNDAAFESPNKPFIYAVTRMTDETGHHHTKLICGYGYRHQNKL